MEETQSSNIDYKKGVAEVTEASEAKFLLVSINVHLEGDDSSSSLKLLDFLLQQLMLSHIIALVITDV